jgi:RNase P subunit RPR2
MGRKPLVAAARRFACTDCGAIIGDAGVDRADALWHEHMKTLMAQNPHVRMRVARDLDAVCTACGARYRFEPATSTFSRWA